MSQSSEQHDHSHRDVTGGWLRPTVFGAMDGLLSNSSLMAGVAGGAAAGGLDRTAVLLAGLAGLVAGAFSMAAGEYVSVASQAELAEAEFANERRELSRNPQAEIDELAAVWVGRGIDAPLAQQIATQLSKNPEIALEVHAREELGMAPGELPRPWVAALSSFLSFAVGASIPVIPYLLGATGPQWSAVVTALALFVAGVLVSRVTVRSWWYAGLRQLLLGAVAAVVTYAVGAAIGTSIS